MATQRLGRRIGGQMMAGVWMGGIGLALALVATLIIALAVLRPQQLTSARPAAQPVVGQAMVVTAPVWDGATYRSQPVRVGGR